jgi:hypothetical protein
MPPSPMTLGDLLSRLESLVLTEGCSRDDPIFFLDHTLVRVLDPWAPTLHAQEETYLDPVIKPVARVVIQDTRSAVAARTIVIR